MSEHCSAEHPFVKRILQGLAAVALGVCCLAVFIPGPVQKEAYMGALYCGTCHQQEYSQWVSSPHASVQCETCHGPGKYYAALHIKKDPELSKLLFMQRPDEQSCRHCHLEDANLWSPSNLKKIKHWNDTKDGLTPN